MYKAREFALLRLSANLMRLVLKYGFRLESEGICDDGITPPFLYKPFISDHCFMFR